MFTEKPSLTIFIGASFMIMSRMDTPSNKGIGFSSCYPSEILLYSSTVKDYSSFSRAQHDVKVSTAHNARREYTNMKYTKQTCSDAQTKFLIHPIVNLLSLPMYRPAPGC